MVYAIGIYDRYASAIEERLGPQLLSDITELSGGSELLLSTMPMTWGMWRPRLESNSEISMCWGTARTKLCATANGVR